MIKAFLNIIIFLPLYVYSKNCSEVFDFNCDKESNCISSYFLCDNVFDCANGEVLH